MSPLPAEPASEPSLELEVPAEIRRTNAGASQATGCVLAAIFVIGPAILYFGFFGVLLIDELVLRTNYFAPGNVPPFVSEGLQIIYAPLIFLVRMALQLG